jgi:nicotinate-nucleotide pyrophosphorylase (carboxylating)
MELKSLISNIKYRVHLDNIVRNALHEDIPNKDITSHVLIKSSSKSTARIIAKQEEIICGVNVAVKCFKIQSPSIKVKALKKDGQRVKYGDVIMEIKGKTKAILEAERTALNFLQHLSGIATYTNKLVQIASKHGVTILDTRKTIPGLRFLAKYAVLTGGGKNHRFHLSDDMLVKENHIMANQDIENTLKIITTKYKKPFEIEVESLDQLKIALKYKAPFIMLDNFKISDIKKAVKINNGQAKLEVSGGVNIKNIHKYVKTGIDFISVGAITQSASAIDFSLLID